MTNLIKVERTTCHNAPFDDWSKSKIIEMTMEEYNALKIPSDGMEVDICVDKNGVEEIERHLIDDIEWVYFYKIVG